MLKVAQVSDVTELGLTCVHNECITRTYTHVHGHARTHTHTLPQSRQRPSEVAAVSTLQMQQLGSEEFRSSLDKAPVSPMTSIRHSLAFLMCRVSDSGSNGEAISSEKLPPSKQIRG